MDAAPMAEAPELRFVMRHLGLIGFAGRPIPTEFQFRAGLAVDQIQAPVMKRRVYFLRRQYLDYRDIEVESTKQVETLLVPYLPHHAIGNKDSLSWPSESSHVV